MYGTEILQTETCSKVEDLSPGVQTIVKELADGAKYIKMTKLHTKNKCSNSFILYPLPVNWFHKAIIFF